MHLKRIAKAALGLSLVSVWTWQHDLVGQAQKVQIPIFEYDPTFPKPLPEKWAIGPIGGLAVDRQDHLYVVQRPAGLLTNERFSGDVALTLMELSAGNFQGLNRQSAAESIAYFRAEANRSRSVDPQIAIWYEAWANAIETHFA